MFKPATPQGAEGAAGQAAVVVDVRAIKAARVKAPHRPKVPPTRVSANAAKARVVINNLARAARTGPAVAASDRLRGLREHF